MNEITKKVLSKLPKNYKARLSNIEELCKEESDSKYLVWLNDEWVFDDGSHIAPADSIKEIISIISYDVEPLDDLVSFNG